MVSWTNFVHSIPFSSSTVNNIAFTAGGVALSSFCYGGVNLTTCASAFAAVGALAVKFTKQAEETIQEKKKLDEAAKQEKKKLMESHFQQFITILKQIIDQPENKYTPDTQQKMQALLEVLSQKKFSVEQGSEDLRFKYVPAQAACEHALFIIGYLDNLSKTGSSNAKFVGGIHTANPATPLCAPPKGDVPFTLFASKAPSEALIKTVADRTVTARRLSQMGPFYVIYPREGLKERSAEQQGTYKETLSQYPGFKDTPLDCKEIPEGISGATYVLKFADGAQLIFAISAPQANAPKDHFRWGMWLGTSDDAAVMHRLEEVNAFLQKAAGPAITN